MNAMDMAAGRTHERGLATDLYQLTMAAAYHASGRNERASFELFIRRLPPNRSLPRSLPSRLNQTSRLNQPSP